MPMGDGPAVPTSHSARAALAPNYDGGEPEPYGVSGGSASGGFGAAPLFALIIGLPILAAFGRSRLYTAPVAWRSAALVSLIERPG
jgi:hypothetical protein